MSETNGPTPEPQRKPFTDPIKIGWSTNPSCRVREMNCWYPFGDLRVCRTFRGTKRDEKALHEKFAHLRMRGEWFRPEPELCDFINAIGREAAA